MRLRALATLLALACPVALPAHAETVSISSIGCEDVQATRMAEQALQDQVSGRDHNGLDRVRAYQKQAGPLSCRPLNQGDTVTLVRDQDDMVCVHEQDEQFNGPGAPDCYWMRRRHIKRPN